MRLLILGKNTDDKGTQLEQLTQKMLAEIQGTNQVGVLVAQDNVDKIKQE